MNTKERETPTIIYSALKFYGTIASENPINQSFNQSINQSFLQFLVIFLV